MTSSSFIKTNISKIISNKNLYVTPDIPEKKLNNAVKAFCCEDHKKIIAIYDNTVFGAADEGIIWTGSTLKYKISGKKVITISYEEIMKIFLLDDRLLIEKSDGELVEIKHLPSNTICSIRNFLLKMKEEVSTYKDVNMLITLHEMDEEVKEAYVKIIINTAYLDDGQIDSKELAEIYALITRLDFKQKTRLDIRTYIAEIDKTKLDNSILIEFIKSKTEQFCHESIIISLVKDIFNIYGSTHGWENECLFVKENKHIFGLSDDKINFALQAVKIDHNLLNSEPKTDDEATKMIKDLAAKATSVGVPLGAVYLSGSVIGLSAAGMTSGLATLGMGGVLGLSSMATGIGVAVLLGVGVYQGVKYLTKDGALEKYKMREVLLTEAIKWNQKTISLIINDLNCFLKQINELIDKQGKITDRVRILMMRISQLQGALSSMDEQKHKYQNLKMQLECPNELDVSRFQALTKDATKQEAYKYVMSFYEQSNGVYRIRKNVDTESLEKISSILLAIEYFSASNILKGKATNLFHGKK